MTKILTVLLLFVSFGAQAIELNAKAYYVVNPKTQTVIAQKNAQERMAPASLTKLMTLYLLFQALEQNVVNLESELPISEKAWRKGGSKMFLEVGKKAKVEDLIQGIAVSSGNDACIVVAEYLAGSEEEFAKQMTAKATELGMYNTNFTNASGWPDPAQYTTAQDIVVLAKKIIETYPQYYDYFSQQVFTYSGIRQTNRNGLLRQNVGVDGLKTGHVEEAGYHLVSSGERNGTRLISAVLGTGSMRQREEESLKGLNYGFNAFTEKLLVSEGEKVVDSAKVWLGIYPDVPILAGKNLQLYMHRSKTNDIHRDVVVTEPIPAPIQAGDTVGVMTVTVDNKTHEIPLIAARDVDQLGFFGKLLFWIFYYLGFK